MSDRGKKKRFTASMPAGGDLAKPRWRDDPERPGVQRYWTGAEWDDSIPPRSKPAPSWAGVPLVALGVLIACAVVFAIWRMSQPSDNECLKQTTEVMTGDRLFVEEACR